MHVSLRSSFAALLLVPVFACSSNESSTPAQTADAGSDAGDGFLSPTNGWFSNPLFVVAEPAAGAKPVEIHSLAASDGKNVYVAYSTSAPGGGGNLSVFVTAFNPRGERVFAPVQIAVGDANETDTAIAVRGDTLLVAWTASTDQAHLRWRTLRTDGTLLGKVHAHTELLEGGKPLTASQLNPWVCATPTGFFVAGAWGVSSSTSFQAAGAKLSATGDVDGEIALLGGAPTDTQDGVRVAAFGDKLRATWLSAPESGAAKVKWAELPSAPAEIGAGVGADTDGQFATYNDAKGKTHLRAWGGTQDLVGFDNLGSLPSVAADGQGGVLLLGITGSASAKGALHAVHVGADGRKLGESTLETSGAGISSQAAYDVKVVHITGRHFFVAYQEPTSTKGWVSKGSFITVP